MTARCKVCGGALDDRACLTVDGAEGQYSRPVFCCAWRCLAVLALARGNVDRARVLLRDTSEGRARLPLAS